MITATEIARCRSVSCNTQGDIPIRVRHQSNGHYSVRVIVGTPKLAAKIAKVLAELMGGWKSQ